MDIAEILEGRCWSLICESLSHGDDASTAWVVVGYYMAKPYRRVVGFATEEQGLKAAVANAVETTKDDAYNFLYEYTG